MLTRAAIEFENVRDRELFESKGDAIWPDTYFDDVAQLKALLDKRPAESALQEFLEHHAYLLPGVDALHCGPLGGIVATKFPLGNVFQTDFAFVTMDSQELRVTCVEIESAKKALFRRDGAFNRDYLDAKQQIKDWLFWAQHNISQALDCWQPLMASYSQKAYAVRFQGFLVFGRRSEINDLKKQERWAAEALSEPTGLTTMTYDRLLQRKGPILPDPDNDKIAVCSYQDRRFRVKRVCA